MKPELNNIIRRSLVIILLCSLTHIGLSQGTDNRPNILFCIADDWGWPHAGAYGDPAALTPVFDKLASQGVLFENAFISSPSCTPSRGAILTGQHFWRLEEGANLWSTLDVNIPVYPLLLEKAGYFTGSWRKAWGPGTISAGGYENQRPAGKVFSGGFEEFLTERPDDAPFCFWLGSTDPHRPYTPGIGDESGIDAGKIAIPDFYPDNSVIRNDMADYYGEVQRFDQDVGKAIQLLDSLGELDNTIVVVTGDHGMPFPRCKANLYDKGTKVPLVIVWGSHFPNARAKDFVSLTELAPTFLDFAGVEIPKEMTGQSLRPILMNQPDRESKGFVVFGRERHTPAQKSPSMDGYPSRGIRTSKYLYIRNYFPDRWPAGVPDGATHPFNTFADSDEGPTHTFLIEHKDDPEVKDFYMLSFGKRPAEELYLVKNDPFQLNNLAYKEEFFSVRDSLSQELIKVQVANEDPREISSSIDFDNYPYRAPYDLNKE